MNDEHLSDLELDALRLSEAGVVTCAARSELERANAHLQTCARCAARRDALSEDEAAFFDRFSPAGLAASTLEARAQPKWSWPRVAPALAAAAVLMVVALPAGMRLSRTGTLRSKGAPDLVEVFRLSSSGDLEPLGGLGRVSGGAPLVVYIHPPLNRPFVRLFWSEAPDTFDALYPSAEAEAWQVSGRTRLPWRVELEGPAGRERLVVVFCRASPSHDEALVAIRGGRPDCEVQSREVELVW